MQGELHEIQNRIDQYYRGLGCVCNHCGECGRPGKKYTKEDFKSDVKNAGKGVKDAAVDVGHQVSTGTKKAYHNDKAKIKKDVKDGKPGDGGIAKKNDSQPVAAPGHN